ncbi:MAG: hypothetical protein R6X10_17240 [Desulfobacterales bacterium]
MNDKLPEMTINDNESTKCLRETPHRGPSISERTYELKHDHGNKDKHTNRSAGFNALTLLSGEHPPALQGDAKNNRIEKTST